MKKIVKISGLALIGVLFIATLVFLYMKSRPKKVIFETVSPVKTNIVKKSVATGSVVPRREVEIKPKVTGVVTEIYIIPGQKIKTGDLIAKIKIIPNIAQLNEAESRLARAKISYDDSKIIFEKQDKLYKDKVISEIDYRQSLVSWQNAKNDLSTAESNLQIVREGVSKSSGGGETNTLVRATIDGTVLDVPIKVGNSVMEISSFTAGTTIAIVADMGEMIFQGKVDETEVGKLKTGMPLILTIGPIENVKFNAILEYIAPKGVAESGAVQFEIKAKVKLVDTIFIRSNYSANGDIVLERRDSVLALPENCIKFGHDSAFVEVEKKDQKFEKRLIKTGLSDGINMEIKSGLKKEDKVKVQK
jgi:HlyD family secretion protein